MTANTKTLVVEALRAIGHESSVIVAKLAHYPTDRSCHTCDFHSSGLCHMHGAQEIPSDFLEVGCDQWTDEASPF